MKEKEHLSVFDLFFYTNNIVIERNKDLPEEIVIRFEVYVAKFEEVILTTEGLEKLRLTAIHQIKLIK